MKTPDHSNDRAFADLVRRARADHPAPVDTVALLRVLRTEEIQRYTWWDELATLLDIRGALTACATGAVALFAVGGWMAYDAWAHVLPWADFLGDGTPLLGGVL